MSVAGVAVIFGGYVLMSYGWILIKGYDISFRSWVSPLHPYTWPSGGQPPPTVPQGRVFASSKVSS